MANQMSLFDYTLPMVEVNKRIRLIETFAGYGSQAMALKRLGVPFETYRVIEIDDFAINSYNAIHGTNFPAMDICNVSGDDLGIVETDKYTYILTYSFPCTDISQAGKMEGFVEGSGTRSSLLWEVKRILTECENKPQILLMENVVAIHSQENKQHLHRFISFLDGFGYTSYGCDLNACDFGVAQSRDRFFLISILGDYNFHFPETMDLRYCVEDYFQELTEEEALRYVVKSEKAMNLLVDLGEKGKLE